MILDISCNFSPFCVGSLVETPEFRLKYFLNNELYLTPNTALVF